MLEQQWRTPDGYYSFEAVWSNGNDRQRYPSFYHYYNRSMDEDNNGLRGKEVEQLADLPQFAGLIFHNSNGLGINEHAQHALVEFCEKVYELYGELQTRLELVRSKSK